MITSRSIVLIAGVALGIVEAAAPTTLSTSLLDDCESSSAIVPSATSSFDDCDTLSDLTSFTTTSKPSSTSSNLVTSASSDCDTESTTATYQTYSSPDKESSTSASVFTSSFDDGETSSFRTYPSSYTRSFTSTSFYTSTPDDCDILPTPVTITTSNSEYETSSATSTLPTLWYLGESDGNSCKYNFGDLHGSSEVCVQNGDLAKWERWLDSLPGTFDECASTCMGDYECASFYYANNLCQTFPKTLHDLGFASGKSEGFWYDKHCIECYDVIEKPVDLNFEGQVSSEWVSSPDTIVSSEIVQRDASYDGRTGALKLTEKAETGTGQLDYIPDISVSAGTYRFRFIGMNTFVRGPTDSLKWELVTIQIANSKGGFLYDGPVANGIMLRSPWIQFEVVFEVAEDAIAYITFLTEMTGGYRDWFFDDIVLEKLQE